MTYNGDRRHDMHTVKRDYLVWVGEFDLIAHIISRGGASVRVVSSIRNVNEARAMPYPPEGIEWWRDLIRKTCRLDAPDGVALPPITVDEARAIPDAYWLRIPNFGRKSLTELREIIGR